MTSWSVNLPLSSAPADHQPVNDKINEAALWERLSQSSRRAPLDPQWLGEVYSLSLSAGLRRAIAEKLGLQAERGWPTLAGLIQNHGMQDELILAAGLSHQPDSRDWLLECWESSDPSTSPDQALLILQALACWGGDLPRALIEQALALPGLSFRLAGLQLLGFHAYRLKASELIDVCQPLLKDFREPIVLATIRLLQRQDAPEISACIAKLATTGSDAIAIAALKALGCIATTESQRWLLELSEQLPEGERQQQACKQLQQQYRI